MKSLVLNTNKLAGLFAIAISTAMVSAPVLAQDYMQQDKFGGSAESARMGCSVATDGQTLVVGACAAGGSPFPGAVRIFTNEGGRWSQQDMVMASDPKENGWFGQSVDVDGDTLIVGSAFGNGAYVFTRSGGTWSEQQKLATPDGAKIFGYSVGLRGDTAVVGAFGADEANDETGAAYVFTRSGETWSETQKLEASNAGVGNNFGVGVSIDGDTIAVGATDDDPDTDQGAVFVPGASRAYCRLQTGWTAANTARPWRLQAIGSLWAHPGMVSAATGPARPMCLLAAWVLGASSRSSSAMTSPRTISSVFRLRSREMTSSSELI